MSCNRDIDANELRQIVRFRTNDETARFSFRVSLLLVLKHLRYPSPRDLCNFVHSLSFLEVHCTRCNCNANNKPIAFGSCRSFSLSGSTLNACRERNKVEQRCGRNAKLVLIIHNLGISHRSKRYTRQIKIACESSAVRVPLNGKIKNSLFAMISQFNG